MLPIIEKSIEINASPENVWPMIQWDRIREWCTAEVEQTSGETGKVGETVRITAKAKGVKGTWDAKTTNAKENELLEWQAVEDGVITCTGSSKLGPTKFGTKVTIVVDYKLLYSAFGELRFKLFVQKPFVKSFDEGLKKLKAKVEEVTGTKIWESRTGKDIDNFKSISDHFDQDLTNFWNKANFYLLANTGLFSAFLIGYQPILTTKAVFVVPILGIVIAALWFQVLHGTVIFIEKYREQMKNLSFHLDRFQSFYAVECEVERKWHNDPQTLTQYLPIAFIGAWVVILVAMILKIFLGV